MPRRDGTGPEGMGPMTGRAVGSCAGYTVPGFGFGRSGGGRGHRNMFYATGQTGWQRANYGYPTAGSYGKGMPNYGVPYSAPAAQTKEQELNMLKDQAQYLKDTLEETNKRITELGPEKK